MFRVLQIFAILSLLLSGAIFGFFYAWVCSTMWGLDMAPPQVAIAAMQAMNASVRNAVFAPAFFGTPFMMALTALLGWRLRRRDVAIWFGLAAITYALGALVLTVSINVPMNEALAMVTIPQDVDQARAIWRAYSSEWQYWNVIRTVVSGAALVIVGIGILRIGRTQSMLR